MSCFTVGFIFRRRRFIYFLSFPGSGVLGPEDVLYSPSLISSSTHGCAKGLQDRTEPYPLSPSLCTGRGGTEVHGDSRPSHIPGPAPKRWIETDGEAKSTPYNVSLDPTGPAGVQGVGEVS